MNFKDVKQFVIHEIIQYINVLNLVDLKEIPDLKHLY